MPDYAMAVTARGGFDEVKTRVSEALRREGFGVLTEIDLAGKLRERTGMEMEPYVILGACNPPLAARAVEADRRIGLLLPCNVVLRALDGDRVEVSAINPEVMFMAVSPVVQAKLAGLPEEVQGRLQAVLAAVKE